MTNYIVVIVKLANQSSADQRIECDPGSCVLDLKEKISKLHPSKPLIKDQKLIYSGHLLQDDVLLKTAFRHNTENDEHTVHLVCFSPKSPTTSKQTHSSDSNSNSRNTIPDNSVSSTDGVRRRAHNEQQPTGITFSSSQVATGFESSSVYSPQMASMPPTFQGIPDPVQQMAMVQQMYAQYMNSYLQYIQSGSYDSGRSSSENSFNFGSPQHQVNAQGENLPAPEMARANNNNNNNNAPNNQREAQNRANIQGPLDEDDEGFMRDWLDYMYFAARFLVLLSIVLFYSTFSRFLIVTFGSIIMYFYQHRRHWFGLNNDQPRDHQPHVPQGAPRAAETAEEDGASSSSSSTSVSSSSSATSEEEQSDFDSTNIVCEARVNSSSVDQTERNVDTPLSTPPPSLDTATLNNEPTQPSIFSLSLTFLTTFFTSLIPEQQQVI